MVGVEISVQVDDLVFYFQQNFLSPKVQTGSEATQPPIQWVQGGVSYG
jgi:hypothetical protein